MKSGYTTFYNVNYKSDRFIEVSNDQFTNEVCFFGWIKEASYDSSKDEDTVGVWKLKQLKN